MTKKDKLPEGLQRFVDPIIASAKQFLEEGQKLTAIGFVGNTASGEMRQIVMDTSSDSDKDMSVRQVRRSAEAIKADVVFVVSEAWGLRTDKVQQYEKIIEKYGSIGQSPYAIDMVMFSLETQFGVYVAQCQIKPLGISKKKRTIGEVSFTLYTEAKGRFTDFLQRGDTPPVTLH